MWEVETLVIYVLGTFRLVVDHRSGRVTSLVVFNRWWLTYVVTLCWRQVMTWPGGSAMLMLIVS